MKFALIGLGFISPRHMMSIDAIGGEITCVCDIDERSFNVFEIMKKSPQTFVNWERMMDSKIFRDVDYVSIMTPNHLHMPMVIAARERGKKVICEKPFCLSIEDLNKVKLDDDINVLLQLRYAQNIVGMKKYSLDFNKVKMNIRVHRGEWYHDSWKVEEEKSGGLMWNIGVHYFDIIDREFGPFIDFTVCKMNDTYMQGFMHNGRAKVNWELGIDAEHDKQQRLLRLNRHHDIDLTSFTWGVKNKKVSFADLHRKAYEEIMKGNGVKPKDIVRVTRLVSEMTKEAKKIRGY